MTQEEAIVNLEKLIALVHTASEQNKMVDYSKIIETLEFAAAALRPVSRELVEKVWRGCEKCNGAGEYSRYAENLTKILLAKYCPHCGRPLTDDAVDMVMERLEELKNEAERFSYHTYFDCWLCNKLGYNRWHYKANYNVLFV